MHRTLPFRVVSHALVVLQVSVGLPGLAAAEPTEATAMQPTVVAAGNVAPLGPTAPPPSVELPLGLSDAPSDQELFAAQIFEEPLVPTNPMAMPGENAELGHVLRRYVAARDRRSVV